MATFLFINYYEGLLISDVTAPQAFPLVHSIQEVIERDNINLVIDRLTNMNSILSVYGPIFFSIYRS